MADSANAIFSNPYSQTPLVWSTQGARITWKKELKAADTTAAQTTDTDTAHTFATLTGLTLTASRPISPQFPIGGDAAILLAGVPQGTIQMTSIFGPESTLTDFLKEAGDVCNALTLEIVPFDVKKLCLGTDPQGLSECITVHGCKLSQLSYTMQTTGDGIAMATGTFTLQFVGSPEIVKAS